MAKATGAKATGAKATGARQAAGAATQAAAPSVERRSALAGWAVSVNEVSLAEMPPAERVSLRVPADSVASLSRALGVTLPQKPKTSAAKGERIALWLGPDEWLVLDAEGSDILGDCAKAKGLHSAVGISHRNVAISVTGAKAAAAINSGCPQDLSLEAFPVGACSRTVFGKSEIVLYRTAADAFRVECWRSFSDYVFTHLSEGARGAA
ncbi:sarcosine oxidase subunit gamma [Aquamicrobium soli]|uniref:Sarcosine oxidase subunit gamma n=1 Tax=Aquamicrobium soli TaxID=1811518 RepID=A0ABV7KEY5_9HYPH